MSDLTIKVKYFTDITPLEQINIGNWIDLRCAQETRIECFKFDLYCPREIGRTEEETKLDLCKPTLIPLGVAMELPEGYEAHITVRSSTFKNYGIIQVNSPGIIDHSYKGDTDQWFLACIAFRHTVIPKNERIAQFRIMPVMPKVTFETVVSLGNANRGGHGSTGVK